MDPSTATADAEGWFQRARMVWMAMLTAIGLYGVVLALVAGGSRVGELPQLQTVFLGIAAGSGVAAWTIHRRIARTPAEATEPARRFGHAVVAWSFAESIALNGFVLALLERSPGAAAPFFLASAAMLFATRPRPELFGSAR